MKLPYITLWLISTVLGEVIGPAQPSRDCHVDNCLRAVAGNDVRFEVKSRRADCSRFMTPSTALPASTPSAVKTFSTTTALPVYATLCYSIAAYSSACSCWGITADKFTIAAVPTATITASTFPTSASSTPVGSNSTAPTSSLPTLSSSVLPTTSPSTIVSSLSSTKPTLPSSSVPTTSPTTSPTPTTLFSSTPSTSPIPTSTTTTNSTGGCTGGKCGTYRSWACSGPLGDCLCGLDPDGRSFCFEDNVCSLETNCAANTDCPSSQRCVVGSCCLVGKCVVERKNGVCGNVNGPRVIFGMRLRGEGGKRCEVGSNSGSC